HHQPDRAPQLVLQIAEVVVRAFVHAQVLAQRFGVQAPAFGEGGLAAEAAELGQAGEFLLQRQLEVMAGNRLVQVQVFRVPGLARGQVIGVDVEDARPRAVFARTHVRTAGRRLRAEGFDRTDLERRLRRQRELFGNALVDLRFQAAVMRQQCRLVLEHETRIGLQEFEERRAAALELERGDGLVHLAVDARDFVQADLMDLRRR
ncbi:hypothetical protein CATMIT_01748, partial [Catenibacterium mitsuokai DSM 15897]